MLLVLLQLCFLCGRFGCVGGKVSWSWDARAQSGTGAEHFGLGRFLLNHFDGSQWLEMQCLSAHHAVILDSSGIHLRSL